MDGGGGELPLGQNAYQILGVDETSTFAEVKSAFRRLAKETHPDVVSSGGGDDASASRKFLLILSAYEILSDSERRAHYNSYLLSQKKELQKQHGLHKSVYAFYPSNNAVKQIEVVEWLQLYRQIIDDILSHRKVASDSGFLGKIENEFYSSIHAAYYGPLIESSDFLPDCFEAEERSGYETFEVLHLVTGRDLFGMVILANYVPQLSHNHREILESIDSGVCQSNRYAELSMNLASSESGETSDAQVVGHDNYISDAYDDIELHIYGKLVATASRVSPRNISNGNIVDDPQDLIHVFLKINGENAYSEKLDSPNVVLPSSTGSTVLLGTIKGLGTSPDEGSCYVHDRMDKRTHVIMKHRTLMVKHMHWYEIGDEVSICECRCSRARLPPSKFWLFEPRCGLHDVGGWYIETFGRNKEGRNVLSQRKWEGIIEYNERRLHPAMYLMALAYRTMDIEVAKRSKRTIIDIMKPKLSRILQCLFCISVHPCHPYFKAKLVLYLLLLHSQIWRSSPVTVLFKLRINHNLYIKL